MAVQYAPLFALETQFQAKNGRNLTGGFLRVFYAATDDPADTYSDYNLTRNPDTIVLDDNGRALVICDKSKAYRLEVYDAEGMLLWTEEPVYCSGTGGGGVSITKVISTDGSISIDENVAGSTTTYDIGLAPRDSDEFLEWIKCSEEDCGSTWYPVYQEGTMETEAGQGVKVHKGQLYHFTNTFYVDPDGTGITYDTFKVNMYCNDEIVDSRNFDIDTSVNDAVQCEFSTDVIPADDGHVYFKLTIPATCEVTGEVQCHRIYSGVNAVPDTCATKQWVQETFDMNLSSKVDYSAIEYNQYNEITGISGSAIAGGINSAVVSSIASSVASAYTESAFSSISSWTADFSSISSKADSSSLSAYQPVSAMSGYATEAYVDAKVGDKLDATASSLFLTSLPDDLATTGDVASAVSGKLDKSASGEFYPMTGNPSGFLTAHQSLAGLATVEYVDSSVSSKLDTSAFASASAGFAPTGDYAYNSSVSGKLDISAYSSQSGNFVQSSSFTSYTSNVDVTINNISSSITSITSNINSMSSDVSGKVDQSSMSAWIPYSALDYSGTAISGIGGSSLAGMGGGDYTGIYPVNVDNTAREIAVDSLPLITDSTMTSYASGDSSVIGVAPGVFFSSLPVSASAGTDSAVYDIKSAKLRSQYDGVDVMPNEVRLWHNGFSASVDYSAIKKWDSAVDTVSANSASWGTIDSATVSAIASGYVTGKQDTSGMSAYAYESSNSAKLDKTAQVVTATATQLYAGTSYLTSVNGAPVSASRAGQAANASMATSAYYDGTGRLISSLPDSATVSAIASAYAESAASSKQDTLAFAYNTADQISSINGSALGGMDEAAVSSIASAYAESAASSKLDASASSSFYTTANESGFITGVDLSPYQTTADMSGYIPTSMSSDFQQVTGMSSYALSSDVSATVDLVGTQSANWGGSALALSAGPGVKLEKSGNTLVASTDETLLWSGSVDSNTAFATNESPYNFKTLRFVQYPVTDIGASDAFASINPTMSAISVMHTIASIGNWGLANTLFSLDSTGLSVLSGMNLKYFSYTGTGSYYLTGTPPRIGAIYGINRTAEA